MYGTMAGEVNGGNMGAGEGVNLDDLLDDIVGDAAVVGALFGVQVEEANQGDCCMIRVET